MRQLIQQQPVNVYTLGYAELFQVLNNQLLVVLVVKSTVENIFGTASNMSDGIQASPKSWPEKAFFRMDWRRVSAFSNWTPISWCIWSAC